MFSNQPQPTRVPIRLKTGRTIFGIRFKRKVPVPSSSTPSAGRADRTDAAYQLKAHRDAADAAAVAAAAITLTEPGPAFQPGSLGPAVTKILADNPGLSVDSAIIRAILDEEPEELR